MNSLRSRLTLSYAIVVTAVLVVVSVLVCRITFEVMSRSTLETLSLSVARARSVAVVSTRDVHADVERTVAAALAPGLVVFATGPDGGPGPPRSGLAAQPPSLLMLSVAPLLGIGERRVSVHHSTVLIVPDFALLGPTIGGILWLLLTLLILSVCLAWALAAWLAGQAIAPLVALTRELERFAAGDFAPRPVTTSDRGEMGALITAFNGAAAQVADAFGERLEVERHMRRFIADAGHELRTPLTVITGYLEILRKGAIEEPALRHRAMARLTGEAARMRLLIDRLLALARLERPDASELCAVNVGTVAADAIAHVREARGGSILLRCDERVIVFADPAELLEAIENIVDNAVKYGCSKPVDVRVETNLDQARISVRDRGGGIPEHERARLFERFYRGENRAEIEGSGLGLAIAERAISRCSGRIVLEESRPGHTVFALSIPLAPALRARAASLHLS